MSLQKSLSKDLLPLANRNEEKLLYHVWSYLPALQALKCHEEATEAELDS